MELNRKIAMRLKLNCDVYVTNFISSVRLLGLRSLRDLLHVVKMGKERCGPIMYPLVSRGGLEVDLCSADRGCISSLNCYGQALT